MKKLLFLLILTLPLVSVSQVINKPGEVVLTSIQEEKRSSRGSEVVFVVHFPNANYHGRAYAFINRKVVKTWIRKNSAVFRYKVKWKKNELNRSIRFKLADIDETTFITR